jgi:hypothetical protein
VDNETKQRLLLVHDRAATADRQSRKPSTIKESMTTTTLSPRFLLAVAALLALGLPARALAGDEARATVTFENPEKFTDVKDSITGTDKGRDHYLKIIRTLVEEEAARLLPAGQKLTMTFTDIDLAGDYLPSMASGHDIRVMKDVYSPRMKFTFQIADAAGAVVKEGAERLSDMNYMQTPGLNRSDELFYDKAMLRDWLRKSLK